ncbi:MAG TPA: HAMP domain-containing protein, partial [Nitrospirota bacterium]|nr:HAMP domain-containing protein [Nitrospirota bacterium]
MKFLVLVLGILLLFLGALFILIIQRETGVLEKKATEQQQLVARTIYADLRENMLDGKPRSTLKLLRDIRGSSGLVRLEVLRRDGSPAFEQRGGRSTIPNLEAMIASGEEREFTEEEPLPLHTMLFPLKNEPECRRCHAGGDPLMGMIVISLSLEDTQREIALSTRQLSALFSGLILLMGVTLFIAVRNAVLVPLRELHRGAKAIGIGDLSTRIRVRTRDEFQDVAEAFNEMAGRVDNMYSGLEKIVESRTKELEESFRLLGGIISSMPGGIMLLDMQGRVKLINRYAKQLLGCEQETIIDNILVEALPNAAPFIAAAYEKAGRELFQEVEYPAEEGKRIPLGFSSTHYRGAGGGYE